VLDYDNEKQFDEYMGDIQTIINSCVLRMNNAIVSTLVPSLPPHHLIDINLQFS